MTNTDIDLSVILFTILSTIIATSGLLFSHFSLHFHFSRTSVNQVNERRQASWWISLNIIHNIILQHTNQMSMADCGLKQFPLLLRSFNPR